MTRSVAPTPAVLTLAVLTLAGLNGLSAASAQDDAEVREGEVTARVLQVRASPNGREIGSVRAGETVQIVGRRGNWLQIRHRSGRTGYVYSHFVSVRPPSLDGPAPDTARVTPTSLIVREGPGIDQGIVDGLEQGDDVRVVETQGEWALIEGPNGERGWVYSRFLDRADEMPRADFQPEEGAPERARVTATHLNLRDGPGAGHTLLGDLDHGDEIDVLEVDGNWARIRAGDREGWVHTDHILKVDTIGMAGVLNGDTGAASIDVDTQQVTVDPAAADADAAAIDSAQALADAQQALADAGQALADAGQRLAEAARRYFEEDDETAERNSRIADPPVSGGNGRAGHTGPPAPGGQNAVPRPDTPLDLPENLDGSLNGLSVALDVGHGQTSRGFDPGAANNRTGVREWDLNLSVAQQLKSHLEAMGATVTLLSYPSGGEGPSLYNRGRRSQGHNLFISIHHNAFNSSAQGTETLIHTGGSSQDQRLAQAIQSAMMPRIWQSGSGNDRGVKRQGLGVLRGVPASVTACCLVEGFFVDPANITPEVARTMVANEALGIAEGVAAFVANQN